MTGLILLSIGNGHVSVHRQRGVDAPVGGATAAAGFRDVVVEPTDFELRFRATKPGP